MLGVLLIRKVNSCMSYKVPIFSKVAFAYEVASDALYELCIDDSLEWIMVSNFLFTFSFNHNSNHPMIVDKYMQL